MDELRPCPFCGSTVEIEKVPLWNGSHGYHGCYEFIIVCQNCGAKPRYHQNDTIYRGEEEAKANVIRAWNIRFNQKDHEMASTQDRNHPRYGFGNE